MGFRVHVLDGLGFRVEGVVFRERSVTVSMARGHWSRDLILKLTNLQRWRDSFRG